MKLERKHADNTGHMKVAAILSELQDALPMASGFYCWTNRPDMGLLIQKGVNGPCITIYENGTWELKENEDRT